MEADHTTNLEAGPPLVSVRLWSDPLNAAIYDSDVL